MAEALPLVLCLMGPTASGKTALALELCGRLPCEIISVDSALIYRGMDIGTAKPNADVLQCYPHRLIDILDPAQSYSVADFRRDALKAMAEITQAGKIPLLVGGSMLYFKALLQGLGQLPEANGDVRAEISLLAERQGWSAVHQALAEVDPVSAQRIHCNDPQRLQRALEVYRVSGVSMTEWRNRERRQGQAALPYNIVQIALLPDDRKALHGLIKQRFEQMLSQGLVAEVQSLYQRGDLHLELPAMRCVGYRQIWRHIAGEYSLQSAVEKANAATRQLAKRQLTWLRSWPDLLTIDSQTGEDFKGKADIAGSVPHQVLKIMASATT